jgi:hypothetical protein
MGVKTLAVELEELAEVYVLFRGALGGLEYALDCEEPTLRVEASAEAAEAAV